MSLATSRFCFAPAKVYNIAYDFDGATNSLKKTSNLTGAADSKVGFMSFFIYWSTVGRHIIQASSAGNPIVNIRLDSSNPAHIQVSLSDANGANTWTFESTGTIAVNTWHHIMIAWDSNYTSGNKVAYIYAGDTDLVATTTADGLGAVDIGYSTALVWTVGDQVAGGSYFDGCFGQFAFYPGQTLDITNSSNRRKFSDSSFHPVFIGRSGEKPTGTKPLIYLTSSIAGIGHNSGTGGDFDTINGTFNACGSTP